MHSYERITSSVPVLTYGTNRVGVAKGSRKRPGFSKKVANIDECADRCAAFNSLGEVICPVATFDTVTKVCQVYSGFMAFVAMAHMSSVLWLPPNEPIYPSGFPIPVTERSQPTAFARRLAGSRASMKDEVNDP